MLLGQRRSAAVLLPASCAATSQALRASAGAGRRGAAQSAAMRRLQDEHTLGRSPAELTADEAASVVQRMLVHTADQHQQQHQQQQQQQQTGAAAVMDRLRRVMAAPDGLRFLVDVRARLLDVAGPAWAAHAAWPQADRVLRASLSEAMRAPGLECCELSAAADADLLQQVVENERVHRIADRDALMQRLGPDRRIYYLQHRDMRGVVLAFVEVALEPAPSRSIADVLRPAPAQQTLVAAGQARGGVAYGISSTQRGLEGVSLGQQLIYAMAPRVRDALGDRFEFLCTLSPIPGLRAWLGSLASAAAGSDACAFVEHVCAELEPDACSALVSAADSAASAVQPTASARLLAALPRAVDSVGAGRATVATRDALARVLSRLCAYYIVRAKRPASSASSAQAVPAALDPVANFHLGNGAMVLRVNAHADLSANGLRQSAGMMMNYGYQLGDVLGERRARYAKAGQVDAHESVLSLLGRFAAGVDAGASRAAWHARL